MTNLFEFSSSKRRFAVIGNPVAHSRSPEIHQMFGRQCGITLEYKPVQVDPGGLPQAVRNLQAKGFAGLNFCGIFRGPKDFKLITSESIRNPQG